MIASTDTIEVRLNNRLDRDYLISKACEIYNRSKERGAPMITRSSDRAIIERLCVNYLRHHLSNYKELLTAYGGGGYIGGRERDKIRKEVYRKIAIAYPWLKEECDRQLSLRQF